MDVCSRYPVEKPPSSEEKRTLRRPRKDASSLGKLTQAAMFHLNHRFVAAKDAGQPGTHFFWV